MSWGARKNDRVVFSKGMPAQILGTDGQWRCECTIVDISQTGARLNVAGFIDRTNLQNFFLVMKPGGGVVRRCELIRMAGEDIGVRFVDKPRKASNAKTAAQAES